MPREGCNSCTHDPPILETQKSESNWTHPYQKVIKSHHQDFQLLLNTCLLRACLDAPSSITPVGGILAGTKVEGKVGLRSSLDSHLPGLSSGPTDKKTLKGRLVPDQCHGATADSSVAGDAEVIQRR